jgi:enoyl-CoA hydratase
MKAQEVTFERLGHAGFITLNRPEALNALTLGMVRRIHRQLAAWADDRNVAHVAIRANGSRAFCAGGDVRALYAPGLDRSPEFTAFYREEYRLNTYIKRYPKPFLALVDGLVMGGGVGISLHGSHRIAGGRMVFAMPETGIGLFPDVGATFLLSRLPGAIGLYLGLTGARVEAPDALWSGIVTHCVPSARFPALAAALADADDLDRCLADFAQSPAPDAGALARQRPAIDRLFAAAPSLAELMAALRDHGDAFAAEIQAQLETKSPTSLAITFRQLQEGRDLAFEEAIRREFRIVSRIPLGHDFFEGIRALVIDKDKTPRWRPATLAEVSPEAIARHFAPLAEELDLDDLASAAAG